MRNLFSEPSGTRFFFKAFLPILATTLLVAALTALLLYWIARSADEVAIDRQHRLVEMVLSRLQTRIAHDQESVTVWDDAVQSVRSPGNGEWIDSNLGSWMASYFGHDGAYVLDVQNTPIYAFSDGETLPVSAFEVLASEALPLVNRLRERLRSGDTEGINDRILSLGVSGLTKVAGHPAVVSAKPIISDTGDIEQKPGEEYVHVAVRYLDGNFVEELQQDYLVSELRFSWREDTTNGEVAIPVPSGTGFFIWQPYRPGATVLAQSAPVLLACLAGAVIVLALFVRALRTRSIRLKLSEEALIHLAHHDLLTGLPNRRQVEIELDRSLKGLGDDEQFAVLYLDLDRFKEVNDTLGHPSGDELLREFADRLRRHTSESDMVARLGGDEFLILLRNPMSDEDVSELCRQLVETARRPFLISGARVFLGVSVGVAMAPRDSLSRVELTRRADVALYHAKRSGRSAFAFFDFKMDTDQALRRELERDLRTALERGNQMKVHYQPIFSAQHSKLVGAEALVRWSHPEKGMLRPDAFIPLAEENGMIEQLGEWVLKEACQTAVAWPLETLAVNVSALQLQNPGFATRVASILLETGMHPDRLELEVTESTLSDRRQECENNLITLRAMGIKIALDDFGTGFSSLGRLQEMVVDKIKIDRSFVNGFGTENGDEAIVQAIVDLARTSGLKTTAEGVETQFQRDYLNSIGCDELQGYLLAAPLAPDEFQLLWQTETRKHA